MPMVVFMINFNYKKIYHRSNLFVKTQSHQRKYRMMFTSRHFSKKLGKKTVRYFTLRGNLNKNHT